MATYRGDGWKMTWDGNKFAAEMEKLLPKEVAEPIAKNVAQRARAMVPVGKISRKIAQKGKSKGQTWSARTPGRLRKSIKAYPSRYKVGGRPSGWIVWAGGHDPYYAWMVEFGVPGISQQPYMRPALEAERRKIGRYLKRVQRKSKYLRPYK